jgi:hypothetical protein
MGKLSVLDQHCYRIALKTLRLSDIGAAIMGGQTKDEARDFLKRKMNWSDEKIRRYESFEIMANL